MTLYFTNHHSWPPAMVQFIFDSISLIFSRKASIFDLNNGSKCDTSDDNDTTCDAYSCPMLSLCSLVLIPVVSSSQTIHKYVNNHTYTDVYLDHV